VTNGPQLFYGLRYVIIVNKPDNVKTYHEQVGYFLWEPATNTVIQTLAIPRGQIAMASGHCSAGRETISSWWRSWNRHLRHPVQSFPGIWLPHRRVPHQGHRQ
jgi:hypothetical protein